MSTEDEMLIRRTTAEKISVAWTIYLQVVITGKSPYRDRQIKMCNFIRIQLQISGLQRGS